MSKRSFESSGMWPPILDKFSSLQSGYAENQEGIELLRCLENKISVGTFKINKDIFSVDVKKDYLRSLSLMPLDPLRKKY